MEYNLRSHKEARTQPSEGRSEGLAKLSAHLHSGRDLRSEKKEQQGRKRLGRRGEPRQSLRMDCTHVPEGKVSDPTPPCGRNGHAVGWGGREPGALWGRELGAGKRNDRAAVAVAVPAASQGKSTGTPRGLRPRRVACRCPEGEPNLPHRPQGGAP